MNINYILLQFFSFPKYKRNSYYPNLRVNMSSYKTYLFVSFFSANIKYTTAVRHIKIWYFSITEKLLAFLVR